MYANQNNCKTIMIQGTASDVGKSVISTALCRILAREQRRVAPFKSWNMSLNSFVTPEGGEIGIAQAIQARAAGVIPSVDMQPMLVKPRGDGLSQVIVRGRPLTDMGYDNDQEYIEQAREIIAGALQNLQQEYEIIVMEGAGSPAEVNRMDQDLANMMVARLHQTPVLLVADIDRGGALASLVGTIRLLKPEDRKLVKGFIINRFRGDFDILKPGLDWLEDYIGIPVLGVIPYLRNIKLPEEDSASLKMREEKSATKENEAAGRQFAGDDRNDKLKIVVINLPRISNFTDFKSLSLESDVDLTYVREDSELTGADLIIIPGSKSTTADLEFLKESGMAEKITSLARAGTAVIGICGGYQILGESLSDPHHTEGKLTEIKGLGLLPIRTRFLPEKTTHQAKARITRDSGFFAGLKDEIIYGYEIHMGETIYTENQSAPFMLIERSGQEVEIEDGALGLEGNCLGTYLHGIFNNDRFRRSLLNELRKRKGIPPVNRDGYCYDKQMEADFDELADIVSKNLNMDLFYSILKQGSW